MKAPALAASLAVLAAAGFGAAHALADVSQQQVTLPTTLPGTVTVTLPVTTASVPLPTTTVALPTTTTAPLPTTTSVPLPTTTTVPAPSTTTAAPPTVATTSPSSVPPSSPAPAAPASSPPAPAPVAVAGPGSTPAATPASRPGGLTVTTGPRGRRVQSLGFRLGRPARIVAVFRGPAPSCEIAYTFRGRGRPGANRVPAAVLVRKGIVEAGIYAVRVVAVRGERRRKIGDIVVDVGRRDVRRLPRERHRCLATAARGVLAAAGPTLGGPLPPDSPEGASPRPGAVAAAPELELPPVPVARPSGLPAELFFFAAIALALIALGGMAVSVARALRES